MAETRLIAISPSTTEERQRNLLAVTREFICAEATRSGLDTCLRRHGVSTLNDLKPAQPAPVSKTFKANEPEYLHVDLKYLPQMQDRA